MPLRLRPVVNPHISPDPETESGLPARFLERGWNPGPTCESCARTKNEHLRLRGRLQLPPHLRLDRHHHLKAISEAFALCRFFGAAAGRHPRGALRPPPTGLQGPCGRSIFRTKGEYAVAAALRRKPGASRAVAAGSQLQGAVGRPQRSVAQPDQANQRPQARSARRLPSAIAATVTRPSRRRPPAANVVFLRKRCRPGFRSRAERRVALPRRAAPRGWREKPTVMLVDADDSPARRMPKAVAGQRYLRVQHAPRSASKPVPLDASFRTGTSPLRWTLSPKSGLSGSQRSFPPARRVQRAVPGADLEL